jgi:hypothetical protein
MGWRLLWDEHVVLERGGEQIALIGIQNWSALRNFARYGNLSKAYQGAEKYPFKILLSHDPTHWDAEVRPKFSDIDLTLSGIRMGFSWRGNSGFSLEPCAVCVPAMGRSLSGRKAKDLCKPWLWLSWLSRAGWAFYPKLPCWS